MIQADISVGCVESGAYAENGFFVARGLLNASEIGQIRDTFMDVAKDGPVDGLSESRRHDGGAYDINDPLRYYPRMLNPHRHGDKSVGRLSLQYLLDARIGAVLRGLLGEEPIAAQSMFYFKPPGARGQALHQDNFYLRVKPGSCVAAWIAVDDADEANGGMMCVPGTGDMQVVCPEEADPSRSFTSHLVTPPAGKSAQLIRLRAGDVLFFNGSVIHGSYPNTSKDRFRRSLIFHYVPTSCIETSEFYRPLLSFDGKDVSRQDAAGGGPCGEVFAGAH